MDVTRRNPRKIDVLVINEDAEAPSLLNPTSGQLLITNMVGKRIIELADGTRNVDSIVEEVSRSFQGAERSVVLEHTTAFLEESTEKGIVTWTKQA